MNVQIRRQTGLPGDGFVEGKEGMMAKNSENLSPEYEIEQLIEIGKRLELDLDRIERQGSELNFVAVRSASCLISRRLDSRTLFVQDFRYKLDEKVGIFKGSDEELAEKGKQIFELLELPLEEAEDFQTLTEQSQTASVNDSGKVKLSQVVNGAKMLRIDRRLAKVPVWSSNVSLLLTSQSSIGFLQAHWPEFPQTVIDESCRLNYLVENGWQAPAQEGASPERVEAGICHSPPMAMVMDFYPAIRVIYEPWNRRFGRKLMLYFDRHGRQIPTVRHFEALPTVEKQERILVDEKDC